MKAQHIQHIEQLSRDIAWHRRVLAEKEWMRHEFVKLDEKQRPAQTVLQRWVRKVKRAIAFWLLK